MPNLGTLIKREVTLTPNPTQLLRIVSMQGLPTASIVVGVWPATADPTAVAPDFEVTVVVEPGDDDAAILAKTHKQVDRVLFERNPDAQLAQRVRPYIGVSIPHTFPPA